MAVVYAVDEVGGGYYACRVRIYSKSGIQSFIWKPLFVDVVPRGLPVTLSSAEINFSPKLLQQKNPVVNELQGLILNGGPTRARTSDPLIMSQVL